MKLILENWKKFLKEARGDYGMTAVPDDPELDLQKTFREGLNELVDKQKLDTFKDDFEKLSITFQESPDTNSHRAKTFIQELVLNKLDELEKKSKTSGDSDETIDKMEHLLLGLIDDLWKKKNDLAITINKT